MKINSLKQALRVFEKYDGPGSHIDAEHDEIYAGQTPPHKMDNADLIVLENLGWYWAAGRGRWRAYC